MITRPEIVTNENLEYLDTLRGSGVTNMFGAGSWLRDAFELEKKDAAIILKYWMASFSERHP